MSLFSWRKSRPLHLGKYRMEKIRRVGAPTTKIGDEIPRVPQRANFLVVQAMVTWAANHKKSYAVLWASSLFRAL
ncbi:MAG: hypothetical protein HC804_09090 [Anaerolineae bacterium]|nr:hypothetical protein [Anaerolineae bacterium]